MSTCSVFNKEIWTIYVRHSVVSIHQYAFERRHYEDMTNLFREIENDQHMWCTEIQGEIPINPDLFDTTNLPRLMHQSDLNHEHDIEYLRKASEEGIIVIRCFGIKLQYENSKQRQNIHDINFFINLS